MQLPVRQKATEDARILREDAILFPSGTVQVAVEVTPRRRRCANADLILLGFVSEKEIELVFPGARKAAAVPLLQRLQAQLQYRKLLPDAKAATGEIRQPLRVDGIWRVRLLDEHSAVPERRFQLVAARWRYRDAKGVEHVFGYLPVA
jgi:hypothetical protein